MDNPHSFTTVGWQALLIVKRLQDNHPPKKTGCAVNAPGQLAGGNGAQEHGLSSELKNSRVTSLTSGRELSKKPAAGFGRAVRRRE